MRTDATRPHLLCVGGEDHRLRIPFLLALQNQGFRVTASGTDDTAPFRQADIDYRRFAFDRFVSPLRDWTSIERLRQIVEELRPDIAQSFDTKPNLLLPFACRNQPAVAIARTINGLGWVYSSRSPAALALRPVQRTLHQLAGRYADATIFQNKDDRAFFEKYRLVHQRNSHLICGSGIDIQRFQQALAASPPVERLREELGLGAARVVVTVSKITRQKGIRTLLRAAALVHADHPDVRFLLVGPRESEGRLAVPEAEIRRHAPYVVAVGQRSDVPALLRLADAFAFPTEYREGVPRALLEAGLAECPIVATAVPGCNDVVCHNWNGLLVPPRSPHALATGIVRLLLDSANARIMARRAAELVRSEFGLDLTIARYCTVYSQLLSRPGRSQKWAQAPLESASIMPSAGN